MHVHLNINNNGPARMAYASSAINAAWHRLLRWYVLYEDLLTSGVIATPKFTRSHLTMMAS